MPDSTAALTEAENREARAAIYDSLGQPERAAEVRSIPLYGEWTSKGYGDAQAAARYSEIRKNMKRRA